MAAPVNSRDADGVRSFAISPNSDTQRGEKSEIMRECSPSLSFFHVKYQLCFKSADFLKWAEIPGLMRPHSYCASSVFFFNTGLRRLVVKKIHQNDGQTKCLNLMRNR